MKVTNCLFVLFFSMKKEFSLQIHCNGDAAIEMAILAVEKANRRNRRTTLIHCQTVSDAQLERMRDLDIHPSFLFLIGDKKN
jgi:predicted amidohydrolase YtcJ